MLVPTTTTSVPCAPRETRVPDTVMAWLGDRVGVLMINSEGAVLVMRAGPTVVTLLEPPL